MQIRGGRYQRKWQEGKTLWDERRDDRIYANVATEWERISHRYVFLCMIFPMKRSLAPRKLEAPSDLLTHLQDDAFRKIAYYVDQ